MNNFGKFLANAMLFFVLMGIMVFPLTSVSFLKLKPSLLPSEQLEVLGKGDTRESTSFEEFSKSLLEVYEASPASESTR